MHLPHFIHDAHSRYRDSLLQREPPDFVWLSRQITCRGGENYRRIRELFDSLTFASAPAARFLTWRDACNYSYLRAPWISHGGRDAQETLSFVKRYGAGSMVWPFRADGGQLCVYSRSAALRSALWGIAPEGCLETGDSLCLDLVSLTEPACRDVLAAVTGDQGALLHAGYSPPAESPRLGIDAAHLAAWSACPDVWL